MSIQRNRHVFGLTKLMVAWKGPFKRGFGGGLAVVGRDESHRGILAVRRARDLLLPTALRGLQATWEQPCFSRPQKARLHEETS